MFGEKMKSDSCRIGPGQNCMKIKFILGAPPALFASSSHLRKYNLLILILFIQRKHFPWPFKYLMNTKLSSDPSTDSGQIPNLSIVVYLLSQVWLFVTPWTVACRAPLSMEFPRKNTGVGCHFTCRDLPDPGSEARSPAVAGRFFTTEPHL